MKGPLTPVAVVCYSVFLVPDYKGCRWRAVNEFSSSTGSHVSPACVHWPFPLWNRTPPHSHQTPPPHPTSSPLLSENDPQTLAIVHLIFLGLSVSPRVSDHCQPIWLTTEETTEQDSLLAASFYTTSLLGQWLQERVDGQDMAPRIQIPPFISRLCCYN